MGLLGSVKKKGSKSGVLTSVSVSLSKGAQKEELQIVEVHPPQDGLRLKMI